MAISVNEVAVPLPDPALENADWADAFQLEVPKQFETARAAAEATFQNFPGWTKPLLRLRNWVVQPLGLKTADRVSTRDTLSFFPVLSETQSRVVGGFDDSHLDFRVVVDLAPSGTECQRIKLTTLIRRHNPIGKAYLLAVTPFHRAIIRGTLERMAKQQKAPDLQVKDNSG